MMQQSMQDQVETMMAQITPQQVAAIAFPTLIITDVEDLEVDDPRYLHAIERAVEAQTELFGHQILGAHKRMLEMGHLSEDEFLALQQDQSRSVYLFTLTMSKRLQGEDHQAFNEQVEEHLVDYYKDFGLEV